MTQNHSSREPADDKSHSKVELINEHALTKQDSEGSKIRLLNELQVYQAELEMQNLQLKETQQQLEETRDRYADLFDFAPVGYLMLDENGRVLKINLTGAAMLGRERAVIVEQPFVTHIAEADTPAFVRHLQQVFSTSGNIVTELRIRTHAGKLSHIRLESSAVTGGSVWRMVMTDIRQLKDTARRNRELLQENRILTQSLFKVQEEERRHLARELHDELGQWLTAIYAEAQAISNNVYKESSIHASAQAISKSVGTMHDVIHDLLHQLRPALLDALGLADSLRELKKQWCARHPETVCELALEGEFGDLSEIVNITIYRIIQEALTNVSSHAQASRVMVQLTRERNETAASDALLLSVEDNGKGYNPGQHCGGLGLLGMRERVIAAGGEFTVHSAPGHGTRINVKLPLKQKRKEMRRAGDIDHDN